MEHHLESVMHLPLRLEDVFSFFANARNLGKITPPELCFRILSPQTIEMREGAIIDYRLCLWGVPFLWRAKISKWNPPHTFVDEQMRGPYKKWIHTHRFWEENGNTVISDRVVYMLPYWPFGEVVFPLVQANVKRIFRFRKKAIVKELMPNSICIASEQTEWSRPR